MKSYVYVLYSKKLNKYYTGITLLSPEERLQKHLDKTYGNHRFTATADDWMLFWSVNCHDIAQARRIELHIKKMKSKKYIQNLVKYPEITQKLLIK